MPARRKRLWYYEDKLARVYNLATMKRLILFALVGALYALHQDAWFWRTAEPLVFGAMPIGLFYHAGFTLVTALVLWVLVRHAWPAHLESAAERPGADRGGTRS